MEKLPFISAVQQLCSGNLSHMANVLISQCCWDAGPCCYQDLRCSEAPKIPALGDITKSVVSTLCIEKIYSVLEETSNCNVKG